MPCIFLAFLLACAPLLSRPEPPTGLIEPMEVSRFVAPPKTSVSPEAGRNGPALRFTFEDDCQGKFIVGKSAGSPEWDRATGFSFWVKGDGSAHLGGIEFVWNGDYSERFAFAFPIDSVEWRKIVVAWHDLIPETGKSTRGIDPHTGLAPSRLGPIEFGKWWYWRDYAAHAYTIGAIQLEPTMPAEASYHGPSGDPLAPVLSKLKEKKPITIVTMGDSLTDVNHWTNREHNWPALLQAEIRRKFGSEVTITNPAMGGTELRQNLIVMPRWLAKTPAPDLVTVFFGFNDYNSGMRGPAFESAQKDAIARIRRATRGRAAILILTSCPTLENPALLHEMAEACRRAAKKASAGMADVSSAFLAIPESSRASLYATDKVHLSLYGQETVAKSVLQALKAADRK